MFKSSLGKMLHFDRFHVCYVFIFASVFIATYLAVQLLLEKQVDSWVMGSGWVIAELATLVWAWMMPFATDMSFDMRKFYAALPTSFSQVVTSHYLICAISNVLVVACLSIFVAVLGDSSIWRAALINALAIGLILSVIAMATSWVHLAVGSAAGIIGIGLASGVVGAVTFNRQWWISALASSSGLQIITAVGCVAFYMIAWLVFRKLTIAIYEKGFNR